MAVRKIAKKWQYDFRTRGKRYRKSGFRTKAQALAAEKRAQEDAMSDRKRITLANAYEQYMSANINMKPLGRDHWHRRWPLINPVLGHRSAQSTEVYAHLGSSAQLRLVRALEPASPPHRGQYLVNERRPRKPRNA